MSVLSPSVHRAIVCVDVERFGDRRRTNPNQVVARDGLYHALSLAFFRSGMCWEDCYHEDCGDGALVLVPSDVPKSVLVTQLPRELVAALSQHNQVNVRQARIRLRRIADRLVPPTRAASHPAPSGLVAATASADTSSNHASRFRE